MNEYGSYYYVGYCMARDLHSIHPEQARKLTHLNVAFAVVENDKLTMEADRQWYSYLDKIKEYNPNLNIMISTGGGSGKGHGHATKPEQLDAFVESTMKIVREFDLDGIDCDWEFPCDTGDYAEIQQHVELMKAYRRELTKFEQERGRKCWLSIAAGCRVKNVACLDIPGFIDELDYINIMTYDWRYRGKLTGHHSCPLPHTEEDPDSVTWSVDLFHKNGTPLNKIVVGCAFYSHRFDGVVGGGTGLWQPYTGMCDYGPSYTAIHYIYEKSTEWVKYWDDTCKAPYLFNGESFITYDDPQSIKVKADIVKDNGLAGLMYWVHGSDDTSTLFNAAYDALML